MTATENLTERMAWAIVLAPHPSTREWAIRWLSGEDRTTWAAWAAANAASANAASALACALLRAKAILAGEYPADHYDKELIIMNDDMTYIKCAKEALAGPNDPKTTAWIAIQRRESGPSLEKAFSAADDVVAFLFATKDAAERALAEHYLFPQVFEVRRVRVYWDETEEEKVAP